MVRMPFGILERCSAAFGTGVEPVTPRLTVWCSTIELTGWFMPPSSDPVRGTHSANRIPRAWCAAGQTAINLASNLFVQRRRWESNPLKAALQAAAVPSGSDVVHQASSPGIEPGPRPSQSRMRVRHTPRTCCFRVPCRGIEPRLAVSRTAVLSGTLAGHQLSVSRPGIEPGPRPSESPMQSATPSGHR